MLKDFCLSSQSGQFSQAHKFDIVWKPANLKATKGWPSKKQVRLNLFRKMPPVGPVWLTAGFTA